MSSLVPENFKQDRLLFNRKKNLIKAAGNRGRVRVRIDREGSCISFSLSGRNTENITNSYQLDENFTNINFVGSISTNTFDIYNFCVGNS